VWTTLKTPDPHLDARDNKAQPQAVLEWMQLPKPGSVSLAQLPVEKLAWVMHPDFRGIVERSEGFEPPIFGETVAFPLHDVWAPPHEVYTLVARFVEYMTTELISVQGHTTLDDRWPFKLPLVMATGCEVDEKAITSPGMSPSAAAVSGSTVACGCTASMPSCRASPPSCS
jgi:hypothetical protein